MNMAAYTGGAVKEGSTFTASFSPNTCANCGATITGKGRVFCTTCSCERQHARSARHWLEVKSSPQKHADVLEVRRWWWKEHMTTRLRRIDRAKRRAWRRRHLRQLAQRPCAECGLELRPKIVNGRLSSRVYCPPCARDRATESSRRSHARMRTLAVAA